MFWCIWLVPQRYVLFWNLKEVDYIGNLTCGVANKLWSKEGSSLNFWSQHSMWSTSSSSVIVSDEKNLLLSAPFLLLGLLVGAKVWLLEMRSEAGGLAQWAPVTHRERISSKSHGRFNRIRISRKPQWARVTHRERISSKSHGRFNRIKIPRKVQ